MRAFADLNQGKPYCDQVKPFNFVLTSQVNPFGHPADADRERFHLISPYETDAKKWLRNKWIDQYTGTTYRITTDGHYGSRNTARVRTYGEILMEYEFHPESKCADADGNVCDRQTVGLLQRRHIRIGHVRFIGKESNSLEDVESGMVQSAESVYTEYPDSRRDEWTTAIVPALLKIPRSEIIENVGISRMALYKLLSGRSRPRARNLEAIVEVVRKLALKGSEN